jgi:hypothetical protein
MRRGCFRRSWNRRFELRAIICAADELEKISSAAELSRDWCFATAGAKAGPKFAPLSTKAAKHVVCGSSQHAVFTVSDIKPTFGLLAARSNAQATEGQDGRD